ncbi:PAS domain-containing protein [Sediminicola luteus]|uniref:histidine kinase n=1 Tax=Sediminicola luteus TaxID=319238 RepID=A0ABV2TWX6_9FLAO
MESNQLEKILPLLDLAKYIGRASTVVLSRTGDQRESYHASGESLSLKDKGLLEPLLVQTLNSPSHITIIPNVQKLDSPDPGKWGKGDVAITGFIGCPLSSLEGKFLGVLSLIFDAPFEFTSDQEKALLTVVSQVSDELKEEPALEVFNFVQKELELQKEINKNIVENSKLSLWTCNLEEDILYVDAKWAAFLGYEEEELHTLTLLKWESMIHQEDLEVLKGRWKDYLDGTIGNYKVSYRIRHKDGTWKWFLESGNTVKRDNKGVPLQLVGTIEDVTQMQTDYKHLEGALQRLTYLSKATSDAIWDLDLENETLHWNDNFFENYGHEPEEYAVAGLTLWIENIHPEDRVRVETSFDNSLLGDNENWEEEYRFRKANGEYLTVNDKAFIIRDAHGKAVRMIGALCDITEKNNYLLKAKIANERFQRIIDLTKEVIYDWDIINEDVYWGSGYVKQFGHELPEEKVTLQTRINHMHPDDVHRVLNELKELLKNPDQNYFEVKYRFLKGDGTYIDIHEKASILRNDNGGPFRMVGSMRDVSEANRYLEKLKESEKKYNDLFHLSPQPSWVYDIETLRFLDVNSAAIDCYGYSLGEFMKLTLADIRPEGEIKPLMMEIENVRSNSERIYKGVFRHCKSNGEEFDVRIYSNPINFKGRVCRQVVAFDISELTKHIKTIESQNSKFNKIAWMQSHVLRAPLVRMMGLTNLLLDPEENMEGENKFLLEEIRKSSNEIDQITRDIAQITNELKTKQLNNDQ